MPNGKPSSGQCLVPSARERAGKLLLVRSRSRRSGRPLNSQSRFDLLAENRGHVALYGGRAHHAVPIAPGHRRGSPELHRLPDAVVVVLFADLGVPRCRPEIETTRSLGATSPDLEPRPSESTCQDCWTWQKCGLVRVDAAQLSVLVPGARGAIISKCDGCRRVWRLC